MRDYWARWLFIGACALVGSVALVTLGIGVDAGSARPRLETVALLFFLVAVLGRLAKTMEGLRRPIEIAIDFSLSLAQLVAALAVIAPFSYLAAMSGFPLVDAELARLDAMMGFHWDSAARWVTERPAIDRVLSGAYLSLVYQSNVVLLVGSVFRTGERNREVIWLTCLGLVVCIAISAFMPALGKVGHVGTGYLATIEEIRSGNWSVLDYDRFEGIITFPSFHMASAIFLIYVVRHFRPLLWVFAPLNLVMMAATPTVGGHYLVDILAGAAVAAACILLVRRAERWSAGGATPPIAPRRAFPEESLSSG